MTKMNFLTNIVLIRTTKNGRNHLWESFSGSDLWVFSLAHVLNANREGNGIRSYTSTSHQRATEMLF